MLTLLHALQDETADHWRLVAQAWGVEYPASARDPLSELIVAVLNPERVAEIYRALEEPARKAVDALRRSGGKMPVVEFFHRYGEIRSMGPARLRREQPWLNPVSTSEGLWYSGWLGRAFIRAGGAAQEYIFLPGDLEALIPAGAGESAPQWNLLSYQPGRRELLYQAGSRSAEDACTLLAFVRNWPQPARRGIPRWIPDRPLDLHAKEAAAFPLLYHLLLEQGLLQGDPLQPDPESARVFLERSAGESSIALLKAWRDSSVWNDLEHMGGLTAEGAWPNDPRRSRREFLDALRPAPRGQWCTIESAVEMIRRARMEFLRPASEFDSWSLHDEAGEYLRGMESWNRVEGTLVRFYLAGPMAWLGAVDLAPREAPKAFRFSPPAAGLWDEETPAAPPAEARARIRPDGSMFVLPGTPPLLRYQLARCANWLAPKGGAYVYRISPRSLARAREQGVRATHILSLLETLLGKVPPGLAGAVRHWEQHGSEAVVRTERILTGRSADAAAKIDALARRDRSTVARLEGPVYVVSRLGVNRLRVRLMEEEILLDDEEEL
jgi:hypothetical protein